MEKFQRENPDSPLYHENLIEDMGTRGTPFHRSGTDFRSFMENVDRFEPNADAYIYVVVLKRPLDQSMWYYIGKAEGEDGLKRRLSSHVKKFDNSRPVRFHDEDVLKGGSAKHYITTTETYRAVGIDRVKSIDYDKINFDSDREGKAGTSHARSDQLKGYRKEQERKMAYQVAIDYETTNVLGGK